MVEELYFPSSTGRAYDNYYNAGEGINHTYKGKSAWSHPTYISQGGVENDNWDYNGHYNYYGIMYFDFAAIRNKAVTHIPTNIRIKLRSATSSARTIYVHMGKGMAKDTYAASQRPVDANGTTRKTVYCSGNSWCEINTQDETWLSALLDVTTTCFL